MGAILINKFKKKILLLFLSIIICNSLSDSVWLKSLYGAPSIDIYQCSVHLCQKGFQESISDLLMKLWTKIDLIRAINLSEEQKTEKVELLLDYVLALYYIVVQYHVCKKVPDIQEVSALSNLVKDVENALNEVFATRNSSSLVALFNILNRIDSALTI